MTTNNYLTQHLWEWNIIINCKIRMLQETRIVFFSGKRTDVMCCNVCIYYDLEYMCVNCSGLLHYAGLSILLSLCSYICLSNEKH